MRSGFLLLIFVLFGFLSPAFAQPQLSLELFSSGFESPVGIVNAGDDRLFIIEQRGKVQIVEQDGSLLATPFLDLSDVVSQSGFETGLLGLAFHPRYSQNGRFFVNYTREPDGTTVVARFTTTPGNPDQADRESEVVLLTVEQPYANHNGGQLLFGPDGYLYIALGDGGSAGDPQGNGQNLKTLLGKMLRINVDADSDSAYVIPPGNPFAGDSEALDEIWAYGLRNPWRNSFDRFTGDFWIADVGQNNFEEVNFQPAGSNGGENYGWRCYEADMPFNTGGCGEEAGYVFPVFSYPHQGEGCSGSITGGYVYRGALYSGIFGTYITADFCTGKVYAVKPSDDGYEGTQAGNFGEGEVTAFGEDRFGELYVVKQGAGEIYRLVETGECKPAAFIMENDSDIVITPDSSLMVQAFYNPSLDYQWYKNEEILVGKVQHELEVTEEGIYTVHVTNTENGCTNVSAPLRVSAVATAVATEKLNQVRIFPNPASDVLHIEGLPGDRQPHLSVFDSNGRLVFDTAVKENVLLIPANQFPAGLYHIRIVYDSEVLQEKVLIRQN